MELVHVIEVLLFTANKPLSSSEIQSLVRKGASAIELGEEPADFGKVTEEEILTALHQVQENSKEHPIFLQEIAGGWRYATAPVYARWVRQAQEQPRSTRLTQPALETLAVIAYRQPISRSEIEAIRGVAAGGVLETLIDRQIIRVAGRAEVPGRPLLYETTPLFLEHFGLADLTELPNVEELKRVKLPTTEEVVASAETPELIHETPGSTS